MSQASYLGQQNDREKNSLFPQVPDWPQNKLMERNLTREKQAQFINMCITHTPRKTFNVENLKRWLELRFI